MRTTATSGLHHWPGSNLMQTGRPSKYKPEYAEQAKKLCALGATDVQLADFFGVAVSTVALWKVQHQDFSDSTKIGKEAADDKVEQSLYRSALGYEHDEIDIRVVEGQIVQTPIRKYYAPNPTSMIFWLKNRKKEQWRDKLEHDVKEEKTVNVIIQRQGD